MRNVSDKGVDKIKTQTLFPENHAVLLYNLENYG
jgi:hypothetical protein